MVIYLFLLFIHGAYNLNWLKSTTWLNSIWLKLVASRTKSRVGSKGHNCHPFRYTKEANPNPVHNRESVPIIFINKNNGRNKLKLKQIFSRGYLWG